jgi:serine/threonine-protein kinase
MALQAGSTVGEYRIMKKLGEGGMGEVFLAVHQTLGQQVVLKGLREELLKDAELRGRLAREAETMARLKHPNIVTIYNFIEPPEGAYIVMEFVQGKTFDDLIGTMGAIPPAQAVDLMLSVLRAFEYAHGHGVIHRDIKPANLMLNVEGQVRVLDFGTAKLIDKPGLTRAGMTLGTACYMSPEQLMGRPLTPAADIYALGATLYEMLAGRLPFESEETLKLIRAIHKDPPQPPSVFVPTIPKRLDEAILRCLAKKPEERFQTAREFADALDAVLKELKPAAPKPEPERPAAPGAAPAPGAKAEPGRAAAPRSERRGPLGVAIAAVAAAGAGFAGVAGGLALVVLGQGEERLVAPGLLVLAAGGAVWLVGTIALSVALVRALGRERDRDLAPPAAPLPMPPPGFAPMLPPPPFFGLPPGAFPMPFSPGAPAIMYPPMPGMPAPPRPTPRLQPASQSSAWRYAPFDPNAAARADAAPAPAAAPAVEGPDPRAGRAPAAKTVVLQRDEGPSAN